MSADNFHVLNSRLRLSGTLVLKSALHIGAVSDDNARSDMPVLRDHRGLPFIPGASLKGVIRSTTESLLRAVDEGSLWACNPLRKRKEGRDGPDRPGCGDHGNEERAKAIERIPDSCPVCQLFGSHVLASHVRFSDSLLEWEEGDPDPVEVRDGVAIDRDLKRVHGGQKYDFDVVSPGARFKVEVFVENPEPWLMGLLMAAFEQVDEGFSALGGFSSRGLGRVELKWSEVLVFTAEQIFRGGEPEQYVVEPGGGPRSIEALLDRWRGELARQWEPQSGSQG